MCMCGVHLPLFHAHEMCKIKSGGTNYIELSGDFMQKVILASFFIVLLLTVVAFTLLKNSFYALL